MHNLPSATTSFIGRQAELAEIALLMHDPACRLLTLLGPGGIGKSRLAVQAAYQQSDQFADGVYFVPLTPIHSADLLISALNDILGLIAFGQELPRQLLIQYLFGKELLLVLDGFEHLIDAASDLVVELLAAAGRIKILVTSREVLNLREEWIRSVDGLPYPVDDAGSRIDDYAAVQLFADRARQVRADFSLHDNLIHVIRICRLVEGIPLGIELAAAWIWTLPCSLIADEIQQRLDFLSTTLRNIPERHRSMRAVFEQSWRLLSAHEQAVFKRLAVFRGSFSREAAERVAGGVAGNARFSGQQVAAAGECGGAL